MTTLSEGARQGDILRWELDHDFSRENAPVVATAALKVGTVLAKKTKSVATVAKASGSGNGTLGTCTLGAKAVPGVYKIVFTTTGATAAANVLAPSGELIGTLAVGTAFASDHINLTISDGATDWTAGDVVTVTVSGDDKYYIASYGAVDGTGEACAILLNDTPITTGSILTILRQYAVLVPSDLIYDSSYDTDNKKAVAVAQLKANSNILVTPATRYL